MPRSDHEQRKMLLVGLVVLEWEAKPATCLWLTGGAQDRDGGGQGRRRETEQAGVLDEFLLLLKENIKNVSCLFTGHNDT